LPESVHTLREIPSAENQREVLVVELGFFARGWWLLRRAFVAAYEDNCFSIAKGAAYSCLLSLFPILTTLTAILLEVNAQPVVHVIATFAQQVVPPGTEDLVLSRLREHSVKPISLPVVAVLLSLWAGSGAMVTLMEGFQAAYRIPSGRPFLKQRAMAVFDSVWKQDRAGVRALDRGCRIERSRGACLENRTLRFSVLHHHVSHRFVVLLRAQSPSGTGAVAAHCTIAISARLAGSISRNHTLVAGYHRVCLIRVSCSLQRVLRELRYGSGAADLAVSNFLHCFARL